MNQSNVEHAVIAAIITLFFGICGFVEFGAMLSIGIFLGREHAQREYALGNPSKLIGYEALDIWNWKKDSILDLLFPVISSVLILVIFKSIM